MTGRGVDGSRIEGAILESRVAQSDRCDETGAMSDETTPAVTITPTTDGPYEVVGEVRIAGPDGTVLREGAKIYLCRCGHSANKPFCDGSHKREGWTSS